MGKEYIPSIISLEHGVGIMDGLENDKIIVFPLGVRLSEKRTPGPDQIDAVRVRLRKTEAAIRSLKATRAETVALYLALLSQIGTSS